MGNHEFGFLEDLLSAKFAGDGYSDTYGSLRYLRKHLMVKNRQIKERAKFFSKLPVYYDIKVNGRRFLITHAYISENLSDLDEFECVWNRELALNSGWEHPMDGVTVVFGYTPTLSCGYPEEYHGKIYHEKGETDGKHWEKINVDCGCVYGQKGHLGILRLDDMREFYEKRIDDLVTASFWGEMDVP